MHIVSLHNTYGRICFVIAQTSIDLISKLVIPMCLRQPSCSKVAVLLAVTECTE